MSTTDKFCSNCYRFRCAEGGTIKMSNRKRWLCKDCSVKGKHKVKRQCVDAVFSEEEVAESQRLCGGVPGSNLPVDLDAAEYAECMSLMAQDYAAMGDPWKGVRHA